MPASTNLGTALLPVRVPPASDRVSEKLSIGTPQELKDDLSALIGAKQVLGSPADLVRYTSDASPYRLIPQVVAVARNAEDLAALLKYATSKTRGITFRSGGTSLNGQAQGGDILVDVRRHFSNVIAEDEGNILRCSPGAIVARANAHGARYWRKLGPDPASSGAATIGGVVANNASGMACGPQGTLGFIDEVRFQTIPLGRKPTTAMFRFKDLYAAASAVPILMSLDARAAELMDHATMRAVKNMPGVPDWAVREGVFAALGAARPRGAALWGEDVCVPPERVAEAAIDIRTLLEKHGFPGAVQGHAPAGNLHFGLVLDPQDQKQLAKYSACMEDLVGLIIGKYDGSLKGEHATGRSMAPYLSREWGETLTGFMRREMVQQGGVGELAENLADAYEYHAVETCAGDASCEIACPVDIDTGSAMKHLRHLEDSPREEAMAKKFAPNWGLVERLARAAIGLAGSASKVVGNAPINAITDIARKIGGTDLVPEWISNAPRAAPAKLPKTQRAGAEAVYFPACINRIFGVPRGAKDKGTVTQAVVTLGERAGKNVWIPDDVQGNCCATVWHSKGYDEGNIFMANKLMDSVWTWTDQGKLPLIVDASSCTLGFIQEIVPYLSTENLERHGKVKILDAPSWASNDLVPVLNPQHKIGTAVVHPTCSMAHLDLMDDLMTVAGAAAERVVTPTVATCCAFAGHRGFLHPELTESATREESEEVKALNPDGFLSGNRTCELGMEHATDQPYESALVALERATRCDD